MKKLLIFFILIPFHSLFSETLVLKDGTIIRMTLKAQDVTSLTYTLKGKEFKVPKDKIRRVVYAKSPELEEKIAKEEVQKMRQEKAAKTPAKSKEEIEEEARLLEEEINKALEEQRRQELLNLSFEERIQRLEKEVGDMKSVTGESASVKLNRIEQDISDLKKRTRRIERFLEIDPDIEEYYNKPRSMWSIVWRSALIPGWGLSYGRDSGFGSMYSTLFFITALGGAGYKSALNSMEKTLNNTFINDFIVQPYALNVLTSSNPSLSSSGTLSTYQTYNITNKFVKYTQSRDSFHHQVENSEKVIQAAVGIYALQLIHSAIYGYFWAKKNPSKFNEEKSSGWNLNIVPLARRNPITNSQDWQMEMGYRVNF
ncbi:MAG TPA: hypothetical protein PKD50_18790 [Leptospiraceae bacterium]|nr:hypothetical protein [Leptospiraceae bacterium]